MYLCSNRSETGESSGDNFDNYGNFDTRVFVVQLLNTAPGKEKSSNEVICGHQKILCEI